MRLTLRTLLAYLDDTLDPEQAKLIGQKVAESPVAQELVERIRKVTRRRSLANPPVVGENSRIDPNTVAEYLDSRLDPDDLSQVEQTCLEDDVYLAEVAACHQILTLMLSGPSRVPPPARQRMYRLVKGRESIPYRRPPAFSTDQDHPEPTPAPEEGSKHRWILYALATVALSLGLALALWLAWPGSLDSLKRSTGTQVAEQTRPAPTPTNRVSEPTKPAATKPDAPKPAATGPAKPPADPLKPEPPKPMPEKPMVDPPKPMPPEPTPPKKPLDANPVASPSADRVAIAQSATAGLVEHRGEAKDSWQSVALNANLNSGSTFMALPGIRADIRFASGPRLQLWGNLLEYQLVATFESVVRLHAPPAGFAADFTLDRGRIALANADAKNPVKVRVRFRSQAWDLDLQPNTEIIVDLLVSLPGGVRFSKHADAEEPLAQAFLSVPKGKLTLRAGDALTEELTAPPGLAIIGWDNKGRLQKPVRIKDPIPHWTFAMPARSPAKEAAVEMKSVVDRLVKRMGEKGATPALAITELAEDARASSQIYSAFGTVALDNLAPIVDAMDDLMKPAMRGAAIFALRHWIACRADNGRSLHQMLQAKKGFAETEADSVLQLLHSFSEQDIVSPATYEMLFTLLNSERMPVRELAYWHLLQLDPDGAKTVMYNPIVDDRTPAINRWRKRLTEGKIPPKMPAPPKPADPKPTPPKPADPKPSDPPKPPQNPAKNPAS